MKYNLRALFQSDIYEFKKFLLYEMMFQWKITFGIDIKTITNVVTIIHSIDNNKILTSTYDIDRKTLSHNKETFDFIEFVKGWIEINDGEYISTISTELKAKISLLNVK